MFIYLLYKRLYHIFKSTFVLRSYLKLSGDFALSNWKMFFKILLFVFWLIFNDIHEIVPFYFTLSNVTEDMIEPVLVQLKGQQRVDRQIWHNSSHLVCRTLGTFKH